MGFQFKVSNDKIEGQDSVPAGTYKVRLLGFKPSASKSAQAGAPGEPPSSINFNARMTIIDHPEFANRMLFDTLNLPGGGFYLADFSHAFGLPLEGDSKDGWLAGDWDADKAKFKPEDPSTWSYAGPLLNRTAQVEVFVDNYNNKDQAKIRRYICAIPDCVTKFPKIQHQTNLK